MKSVDVTDFTNLYASFMRLKQNPESVDVQILEDASEEDSKEDNGED